jgi:hypothetical protein
MRALAVVPAKAGTQRLRSGVRERHWFPAFAGMTKLKTKHESNG